MDINNLTDKDLAHEILREKLKSDLHAERLKELKEEFIIRGLDKFKDDTVNISITEIASSRLNTDGLKDEFGEDWYNARCIQSFSKRFNIKPTKC